MAEPGASGAPDAMRAAAAAAHDAASAATGSVISTEDGATRRAAAAALRPQRADGPIAQAPARDAPAPGGFAAARSAPAVERARPPTPVSRAAPVAAATPALRIGRIDVTVLAEASRAAPRTDAGTAAIDPHFLSRHYLRRN